MRHDIEVAKALGAAGVVLGVLTREATIDRDQTAALVALARPLQRHVPQGVRPDSRSAGSPRHPDRAGRRPRADLGRPADGPGGSRDPGEPGRPRRRSDRRHGRRPARRRQPRDRHSTKRSQRSPSRIGREPNDQGCDGCPMPATAPRRSWKRVDAQSSRGDRRARSRSVMDAVLIRVDQSINGCVLRR